MKKKKATLYIRKNRVNINKKRSHKKLDPVKFGVYFFYYFRRKKIVSNKRSFIKFLNKFISTNLSKVYNFIKIFGLNRNYRMNNFKKKSILSKKLFKKFKLNKFNKKKKRKKKKLKILN